MSNEPVRAKTFSLASAPKSVRDLFDAQERAECSWNWFETLAETTLDEGEQAQIATLESASGNLLSAIPLVSRPDRAMRGLTAPYTTVFRPPLGRANDAAILGQFVAQAAHVRLRLDCLPADDPGIRAFVEGLGQGGLLTSRFEHFVNWFEVISEFSEFWRGRGSQLRSTIKRKSAALSPNGRIRFEHWDLTESLESGCDIYQAIYAKSWKPAEPHERFISTLMRKMGPNNEAQLGVALIDGEPAAAQIWLTKGHFATIFKLAQDPQFDRFSVGSLLTHWMLREFCENEKIREIDFGRGDDAYKKTWLHSRRIREGIIASNPRTLQGLGSVVRDVLPTLSSAMLRRIFGRSKA